MQYKTKLTFKIFWQHARKYKLSMIVIFLSLLIGDAFALINPFWYKKFFNTLIDNPEKSELVSIVWMIMLFGLGHWFFIRLMAFFISYFQTRTIRDLTNTCFKYIHQHSFSFFENNFIGSLVKKVNRYGRAFETIADKIQWNITPIILNVVVVIAVLMFIKPILGIVALVWVIIFISFNFVFNRYKLKYDIACSRQDSKTTGLLADTLTNYSNVKLFNGREPEFNNFNKETTILGNLRRWKWDLGSVFDTIQWFLMLALEIVLMFIAIDLWSKGNLTVGDFVLIQSYLMRIFEQLWNFGRVVKDFYQALADAEEMTEVMDTPHEITDRKYAKELKIKKGKIQFKDVTFCYQKTRCVLKKMNLVVKSHEKLALVGPSGAGKSTIVKLLLRMHDVTGGKIIIDGQKLREVTQESLWQNVSMVPQDPMLFHRSIMENISYGKADATEEEVIEASKMANCHQFISELSEGYETKVGERGIKLSGGERQRVAIARAILRNAPILVLDEATSSLDSESEQLIQSALDNLMKNKTVIVIAHRLSTIMKVDRILVIDEGGIIEEGTHKQLLRKKDGIYKKLWKIQAGGFIE